MRVFFATSEMAPLATTGELAEFSAGFPTELARQGHDVCRVMPCYRQVWESGSPLRPTGLRLPIAVGLETRTAEIWMLDRAGPPVYFVCRDEYFDRRALYSLPERDYEDNLERFIFFQKSVVALIDALGTPVDVVHCNDWQTALVPLFLKNGIQGAGRAAREKTLLTLHNLAFQGIYPGSFFSLTNLPLSCFSIEGLEFYGKMNCLKGGLLYASHISAPSHAYAAEIATEAGGLGLHGVLRARSQRLAGIAHGLDAATWDPARDPGLRFHYSASELVGKRMCRHDLLTAGHVPPAFHPYLVLAVQGRGLPPADIDLLGQAMEHIMEAPVVLVFAVGNLPALRPTLDQWAARWPGRIAWGQGSAWTPSRVLGGADAMLLMRPYEPGDIRHLYALRYGSLPVVLSTDIRRETLVAADDPAGRGNAFLFAENKTDLLAGAIFEAATRYKAQPAEWQAMVQRGMQEDHSWTVPAAQYVEIYKRCLAGT